MIISPRVLRETEERYLVRREPREERRQKISAGEVLEANSTERVQKRLERLARSEAAAVAAVAPPSAKLGGPLDTKDPFGTALERVIGKSDLISVNYLDLGLTVSRTVGRVHIRTPTGQQQGYGTGFMVSPRLLLTNNHVLGSAREASSSWVEFNFQDDAEGRRSASVIFDLEAEAFYLTDEHLDYTLIAVSEGARDASGELRQFGWNRLVEDQGKIIVGEHVNIIQHPNGEPKQLALRENQTVDLLDDFLHYQTDTAPGSSGSPVFNDQWEIVALHHSGVPRRDDQGRLLTRDGTPWTADMGEHRIDWIANEGARASRIVRHVKEQTLSTDAQRGLRSEMLEADPDEGPLFSSLGESGEAASRSATTEGPPSFSVGEDGSAVWTLPLRVSVSLGRSSSRSAFSADSAQAPRTDQIGGTARTDVGVEPNGDRIRSPEDDKRLREALAELEESSSRPYYEEDKDRQERDAYYGDVPESSDEAEFFGWLSELLKRTHANQPRYEPSKHVYPWVDLHPNLKLRSVYSGSEFDPEEVIREDFRIDKERSARLWELLSAESSLGAARVVQELSFLELSLPFNCEHVVPQSWYDEREPMRGDLHHLFACEPGCNSFRSNIPYIDFADFEEAMRDACGKRLENGFEPTAGKGAVARATLYFLLRYPGEINRTAQEYEVDRLETLLDWHEAEPVTEYERHRNAAIFEKQSNRNPLIDFPEWAPNVDFRLGLG
jgi:endonuclease I/V8-like Glu-specific endopeptidase